MTLTLTEQIKRARCVATPLIAVSTADQPGTVEMLARDLGEGDPPPAIISWDMVRGYTPLNDQGKAALGRMLADEGPDAMMNPVVALKAALLAPQDAVILVYQAHRLIDEAPICQALMIIRDRFKSNGRTLILLGPDVRPPAELTHDILSLDEPLPTPDQIRSSVGSLFQDNDIAIGAADLDRAVDALTGLAAFPVEQAASLSVQPDKTVDIGEMWRRKRKMIELIDGLSMEQPRDGFDSLGGLAAYKQFARGLFAGPMRPRCIVFIDELEKFISGATGPVGDSSGVSQDAYGVLLTQMEDNEFGGTISLGPPGAAKSAMARAMAAEFGVPLIKLDLGAAKGSLVGESERKIRAAFKTIVAVAGHGGALFCATCNALDTVPGPLRRRFNWGFFFFDLPDAEERLVIGKIQAKRYGLELSDEMEAFWAACHGWSGANIRDCCRTAHAFSCSIVEAARRIIPAAKQDAKGLDKLRQLAAGVFLSASYEGEYRMPADQAAQTEQPVTGRRFVARS